MGQSRFNQLIDNIVDKEWYYFDKVEGMGGRAPCQDDQQTFYIMRTVQFCAWNIATLESYYADLCQAEQEGRNLLTEKYAYMLEYTMPGEYDKLKHLLPEIDEKKQELLSRIHALFMRQTETFMHKYPKFLKISRPVYSKEDGFNTSIETYQLGELKTYSSKTLRHYLQHIQALENNGIRIVDVIMDNTAKAYGYNSTEQVERLLP